MRQPPGSTPFPSWQLPCLFLGRGGARPMGPGPDEVTSQGLGAQGRGFHKAALSLSPGAPPPEHVAGRVEDTQTGSGGVPGQGLGHSGFSASSDMEGGSNRSLRQPQGRTRQRSVCSKSSCGPKHICGRPAGALPVPPTGPPMLTKMQPDPIPSCLPLGRWQAKGTSPVPRRSRWVTQALAKHGSSPSWAPLGLGLLTCEGGSPAFCFGTTMKA